MTTVDRGPENARGRGNGGARRFAAALAGGQRPSAERPVLPALLAAACVLVPWIFFIRLQETFSIPKLVALWLVLGAAGAILFLVETVPRSKALRAEVVGTPELTLRLYLLLNVLAFAFSIDHRQSLFGERLQYQGVLTTFLYAGFFLLAKVLFDERRRLTLLLAGVAVGATGVAAYALIQKAGLDPIWQGYLPDGRVFSAIGQPNALAAYLVLAVPLSLALLARAGPRARNVLLVATAMMAGALAFTSSRGGYLGLVVSLAILATGAAPHGLWGRARESLRRAVNLLVILLAATVILVAVLPGARTAAAGLWRGVASVGDILQEKSARRHLETWLVAVHITLDHPLFGAGPDTYAVLFPRYKEVVLPRHRARVFAPYRVESPHDVYLAIAAGAGLPALAAYGILVGAVASALLRAARRAEREKQVALFGLLAAMGGHVVTDSFMTADLTGSWLFWLLMGAGLAFARTESPPESAAQAEGRSAAAGGST